MPIPRNLFSISLKQAVFLISGFLTLFPPVTGAHSLLAGMILALTIGNDQPARTKAWASSLLGWSIVGLGAGASLDVVARVGVRGMGYTVIGIAATLLLGSALGRLLKTPKDLSLLLSVGTSICGGSAIAAMASTIRANHRDVSVSLVIVFFLNAVALFIFPIMGHKLGLTQTQFGLWSALAIHDTSSVVGACMQYGEQALHIGSTVKMARALWIIPVVALVGLQRRGRADGETESNQVKVKRPWFILGFIAAAALVSLVPALQPLGHQFEALGKRGLVLALFFIGGSLTRTALKETGWRPLVQGVCLWVVVSSITLKAILWGWLD